MRAGSMATSPRRGRSIICGGSSAQIVKHVPEKARNRPKIKELAAWGCGTTMHVAPLIAPKIDGEDHTKDIDFTSAGIRARCLAGRAATTRILERAPCMKPVDPIFGVLIHDPDFPSTLPLADGVHMLSARTR